MGRERYASVSAVGRKENMRRDDAGEKPITMNLLAVQTGMAATTIISVGGNRSQGGIGTVTGSRGKDNSQQVKNSYADQLPHFCLYRLVLVYVKPWRLPESAGIA
jgi:hypothetical protein